jgi:hAT family C-terminal dimerisation region
MLSSNEWELLQKLVMVLGPFEEATRYLGGKNYITHSMMIPLIERIKSLLLSPPLSNSPTSSTSSVTAFNTSEIHQEIEDAPDVFIMIEEVEILENNIIENNNNQVGRNRIDLDKPLEETEDLLNKVKNDLYNAMCFYWEVLSEDYLLSTILDPRIKLMYNNNIEEGKEILHKKYEEYKNNYLPTPNESRSSSPTPSESSVILDPIYRPRLFSIFEQNQPKASDEVEEYLKEDMIHHSKCPFNWWLNKKDKYPILAKIARIYLAIPAASTSSERLFSDAGNLLSAKRSKMNSELFQRIMFLKRNASKVKNIYG